MSLEQAHAGMRAGMEIGDKLRGNVTVLAGVGVGAHESAALVLSRLTDCPVRDLVVSGPRHGHRPAGAPDGGAARARRAATAKSSSPSRCWRPSAASRSR